MSIADPAAAGEDSTGWPGERRRSDRPDPNWLIAEARRGSSAAFEQLLEILAHHLWRDLDARPRGPAKPSHGSSDLVQDTLLRTFERFGKFDGDTFAEFKQWALATKFFRGREWTRNYHAHLDERHLRRLWSLISARDPGGDAAHVCDVEQRDTLDVVMAAYRELKPWEQFIIDMHVHGNSFAEIAEQTEAKVDTVTKAYHRAIAKLRKKLGHHEA